MMLKKLKEFIAVESIANDEESNKKAIEFICDLLESIGFVISIEGDSPYHQPVIVAKYVNKNSDKKVTLYSHYDVEKIHKKEEWLTNPFVLTEKKGRYYARGIADNKGILLSRVFALFEMHKNGEELPNILWFIQGEEEIEGNTAFEVIPKHIKAFNSKVYLEETGIYKDGVPVIFHLPKEEKTPSLVQELNKAIYNGEAVYANRNLNKFTKCPFLTNVPEGAMYLGFGPNDFSSNIHRPNESLDVENLQIHGTVFKKFISWVYKTEV